MNKPKCIRSDGYLHNNLDNTITCVICGYTEYIKSKKKNPYIEPRKGNWRK